VTPTITWPAPAAIIYGTALGSAQLDATANYPGTFTYSPSAGTILDAGTQTLTAAFTPASSGDVASATATNTITVNKATPEISWNAPAPVSVGTVLGSAQLDATANVPGAFVYSPAAGTAMNTAGTQTLSVTFTPKDSADYTSATASVSLTASASSPPSYSWTNVRIVAGGYITGLYFHPAEQGLMYARTDVGGAYRWGPNDSQWVPLLDFTSRADNNWAGVEAIGLDPTDPNKLYLAVGEYDASWAGNGAVLISDDQGATFATVPLNFKCGSNEPGRGTGNRIAVDPNLPSTIYFGTRDAGLQISTDSGSEWNPVTGLSVTTVNPHDDGSGTESDGVVSVLPIASSGSSGSATPVVYAIVAGTGNNGNSQGVYVTTDGGSTTSTWTAVTGQPSLTGASQNINETSYGGSTYNLAPLEARLSPDGSIYILYGDQTGPDDMNVSQLWRFVPGSNWTSGAWTKITLPNSVPGGVENYTPDGILYNSYGGLAVDPSTPGRLLLGTLDQYTETGDIVYLSDDYGATWRDVSSVNTGGISKSPNLATHSNTIAPYVGAPGTVTTGNWPTAIAIDPFNGDDAMYGFGGGLWMTSDLTNADPSASSTGIVAWDLNDLGIEETAIEGLWAPPSGNTLLLSSIGDVYGFAHQDLTASPSQGNFRNPAATPSSMDFEQNTPTTVVRVTDGTYGATPVGVISTDGGLTWTGFASMPAGTKGGGTIAIAPDGSSMVWATEDTSSVWYSKNGGTTWTASTGIAAQAQVVADRAKPAVFYGLSNGTLTMSTDGGATFTTVQTDLPNSGNNPAPILYSLPDAQGDLWLTAGDPGSGLYANTGPSTAPSLTAVSGVQDAYHLGYGKAAPGSSKLTLFLDGQIDGTWGLYRSTDGGSSWVQINDPAHQWGGIGPVCGDMRTFGTVYLGTWGGRGIIWGTSAN
jgi:hypothetical protein